MSAAYEEIIHGETIMRSAPGVRHERICARLHETLAAALVGNSAAQLLPARAIVQLSPGVMLRPDVALVTTASGRLWLVVEVIDAQDHRADTVLKKGIYEDTHQPRLWMVDPRYNNVEFYHGSPHGLALKSILANQELLAEPLLPKFNLSVAQLFAD